MAKILSCGAASDVLVEALHRHVMPLARLFWTGYTSKIGRSIEIMCPYLIPIMKKKRIYWIIEKDDFDTKLQNRYVQKVKMNSEQIPNCVCQNVVNV